VTADVRRALGFFAAVALVGAGGVLLATRVLGLAAGPENEIVTVLKRTERDGLSLTVPGAARTLDSKHHQFDRLSVSVDAAARTATALATLDFTGVFGETQVSSLGVEKVRFEHLTFTWRPTDGFAPRLTGICAALERRRLALEAGDVPRLAALTGSKSEAQVLEDPALGHLLSVTSRRYRALAWYVRAERDEVLVSEEYLLSGSLPERPIEEQGTRRLVLTRSGGEFSFSAGLM
jgi:hypothetical protein